MYRYLIFLSKQDIIVYMDFKLENQINHFISVRLEPFTLADIQMYLKSVGVFVKSEIVSSFLKGNGNLFFLDEDLYLGRAGAFTGKQFCIIPRQYEIDNKLLITGHRCIPFANFDMHPAALQFVYRNEVLPKRVIEIEMNRLYPYFLLFGKEYISQYKEMLYKYEFLLKTFPELQKYVDDEEALQSLDKVSNYTELTENADRARDYLSAEEWKQLSVDERNQLALDRYKKRPKSNWKIGIEYEMYVDFLLRTKYHFGTIPFGSLKGFDDLGRDIIATRIDVSGAISTYIIQCKYWSDKKEIHENVVCQVFGTTMEYQLKRNLFKGKVIPVIATTTNLSDMAQKFAQKLGVLVWKIPKGEYPMIKCNIGSSGEKIYHLPFDQQYYRTEIKKPGEFYAWTVKEATQKGFRRAFKHVIN